MTASSIFCPRSSHSVAALATAADKPKPSKRLFVAVALPEDVKQLCLETITDNLLPLDTNSEEQENTTSVNWVLDPSLFHCTLQFLGSVEGDLIEDLSEQLREQVKSIAPFTLHLGGLGCFPNHKNTQNASVVWLGLGGDTQELKKLAGVVMDTTEQLGFPRERRPFNAHVTLGRVKRSGGRGPRGGRKRGRSHSTSSLPAALQERIEKMMNPEKEEAQADSKNMCTFHVNHVALMESKLSKGGPQYITLERYDLSKSNEDASSCS